MAQVPCQYPDGDCDESEDGRHDQPGPDAACSRCGESPDEGFEAWRTSATCEHDYCVEAEGFRIEYERSRGRLTSAEREEIRADRELFRDEFHGDHDALNAA